MAQVRQKGVNRLVEFDAATGVAKVFEDGEGNW